MAIKLADKITGLTGNPQITAAELAIMGLTGLLVWLEGDAGYLNAGTWHDRRTALGYTPEATLVDGVAINAKGTRGFDHANSVNLGAIFPVNADYSVFLVHRNNQTNNTRILLGASGSGDHTILLTISSGGVQRLSVRHNAIGIASADDPYTYPYTYPYLDSVHWNETLARSRLRHGSTQVHQGTITGAGAHNPNSSCILGDSPGWLTAHAGAFLGDIGAVMIFSRDLSGSADLAIVENYLMTKYGLS